jgi:hypothetical protein
MNATFVDFRRRSREIIRALERNETVTVLYRGRIAAVMHPVSKPAASTAEHPAFGMWANRSDMADVPRYVRLLRKGRRDAV